MADSSDSPSAAWLAAARSGDLFSLKELHAGSVDPPALCAARAPGVSSAGHTALHWASAGGHAHCVRWLISVEECARAAVNRVNNGGSTPLHTAAANGVDL